ncbi:MAG: ABC transporter ATP-binding protein [Hyphomonadaceae bacterium]|nr:ABC transporter ATP-binding protein [Hyphomonadaceae bacterium]
MTPEPAPLLRGHRLTKTYLGRKAVDAISLEVHAGEVVAFLGPNGAGKTTTMRMLAGILEPDEGHVTCAGFDMWMDRVAAQNCIGYLPEGGPLYDDMSVAGYLGFICDTRAIVRSVRADQIAAAATRTNLDAVMSHPIDTLSKGFKRRVALAGAILHNPPILILDEPTDGLDPNQKRAARALIQSLSPGRAILISTHLLDEVSAICHRAIVVAHGQIVANESPVALRARATTGRLDEAFAILTEPPI